MGMATPELAGRRILVTGGSMGIGYACAQACLEAGARVLICARTERPLYDALSRLRDLYPCSVVAEVADVSVPAQVELLFDAAAARIGGVDGVVHCAAVLGPIGPVVDTDATEWLEAVRVNLFGTFLVAREGCRRMGESGGGRMVLFSGGGASSAFPRFSAYACSKVGVVRFAETLAEEMRLHDVEVNCLAPGFVLTRMLDKTMEAGDRAGAEYHERVKRQMEAGGTPATVAARAVVFLLSDRAKGITGRFVAAAHDGWETWPDHLEEIQGTDLFTLRRLLPRDRGMDWQ